MKDLKRLAMELEVLVAIANEANDKWDEADVESDNFEELERIADETYNAEYNKRVELASAITTHIPQIDSKTAYTMTYKCFNELLALCKRA